MSLEQSKKIIEATGKCWHELSGKSDRQGRCVKCGSWFNILDHVDLSEPYHHYLLIEYVRKICDTETKRMGMEDALNERLARVTSCPYDFDIIVAPSETLVDALCQVIDESQ